MTHKPIEMSAEDIELVRTVLNELGRKYGDPVVYYYMRRWVEAVTHHFETTDGPKAQAMREWLSPTNESVH